MTIASAGIGASSASRDEVGDLRLDDRAQLGRRSRDGDADDRSRHEPRRAVRDRQTGLRPAGRRRQHEQRRVDRLGQGRQLVDELTSGEHLAPAPGPAGAAHAHDDDVAARRAEVAHDLVDERLAFRPFVGPRLVDGRAEHLVEDDAGVRRIGRRAGEDEMDVEAGHRPGGGRQPAVVGPAPAAGDERVRTLRERRPDEELQVAQLVPAERDRQQVLALDPDVHAAAERVREARQAMER